MEIRRTITHGLIAFAAVIAPVEARAARSLTIEEALSITRDHNRTLKAAQATLVQSDAAVEQAWAALLPIVTAQGKYTHNNKEVLLDLAGQNQGIIGLTDVFVRHKAELPQGLADDLQIAADRLNQAINAPSPVISNQEQLDGVLSATIPIIVPASWANLSAAKRQREASDATYETVLNDVLLRTSQAYYAAAGSDELLKVRRHGIEVAKETVGNANARFQSGMVNRVEVTRAEIALLRAEQQEVEAGDVRENLYRALATILSLEEEITVVPPGDVKNTVPQGLDLVKEARDRRPEILQLERSIAASQAQSSAALWRWSPTLSAFGNARAFNYAGFSGDKYAWAIGLELDWTIFDGGVRDAQRHLAEAQREESEAKLSLLQDTIEDEIDNAQRAISTRRRALDTAQRSVDLSKETLELVRAQHDAGTATQIDLLQAQDALISSEVSVAQARFDLALANIQLQHAVGLLSEGTKP